MNPYKYKISFRLRNLSTSLKEIYAQLTKVSGLIPGRLLDINEQRTALDGKKLEGTYTNSYCFFDFAEEWQSSDVKDLPSALESAMEKLDALLPMIKDSGSEAEFFIGLSVEEMSHSLLNIAKRPLPRLMLRGVGLTSKDAVS